MNIELGCGGYKNLGFKGLDKTPGSQVDIVCDLEESIPLPDNSVDLVSASHILEHINNLLGLMDEIYRVCKPSAEIAINVPHYQSMGAWQDPTHVRAFTEATFCYWDPEMPLYQTYRFPSTFKIISQSWTPLGNLEVILKVLKTDEDRQISQEEAIRHEGVGTEVQCKKKRKKPGKPSKPSKPRKVSKGRSSKKSKSTRKSSKATAEKKGSKAVC